MKINNWHFIIVALVMLLGLANVLYQISDRISYQNILIITVALCGWVVAMGVLIHLSGGNKHGKSRRK